MSSPEEELRKRDPESRTGPAAAHHSAFCFLVSASCLLAAGCGRQGDAERLAQAIAGPAKKEAAPEKETAPEKGSEAALKPREDQPERRLTKVRLAVVRVVDGRITDLDEPQFERFLDTIKGWAERMSEVQVEFDVQRPVKIEEYFKRHAEALKAAEAGAGAAQERLTAGGPGVAPAILETLAKVDPGDLRQAYPDAPPDLTGAVQWSEYLAGDLRRKWEAFHRPYVSHAALIPPEHPEWGVPASWRAIAEVEKADLVVTNALIAGPERGMDLERITRGGLLPGLRSAGPKKNPLGATVIASVQPALCRSPFVLDVPDDARPALAGISTWCYLHAYWQGQPVAPDPLGTAARIVSAPKGR